jgi:signal transduction histidine kinase
MNHIMNAVLRIAVWLIVSVLLAGSLAVEPLPRSVLIIDQLEPGTPFFVGFLDAFRSNVNAGSNVPISYYPEHLDFGRYSGPEHEELLRNYFRGKYREGSVSVIVVNGSGALEYALRLRNELWPEVPIVFAGVDQNTAALTNLPSNVTGTTMRTTLRDAVSAARALVPRLERIALVGDPLERQPPRRHFARELPLIATELDLIDLTGLPMTELRRRLASLPERTAILYTNIYVDAAGVAYNPRDAVAAVAEVANLPMVIDRENLLGYGGTGGFVVGPAPIGREAARTVLRILNGEAASNIPIAVGDFVRPVFDWRQLQRFGISEAQLPPGSEIRFRRLSVWDQYRGQIIALLAVLLIQTVLIIGLLVERRRRRNAEAASLSAMGKLAHMNRIATAGELTASIAHEINQPLTAMVINANAGLRWLANKTPDLDEVRAALNRVVGAGHRAGEVIWSVRAILKKDEQEKAPVDLNDVIQDVLGLLHSELQGQGIVVQTGLSRPLPLVVGHNGQLQQVILNLVRNAADAMKSVSGRARVLRVTSAIHDSDGGVLVSVEDSGAGIDPKHLGRIFDSFFTTKSEGMGMGLSICRSIIESHDGRLWVSSGITCGSVFNIKLPDLRAGGEK